MAMIVSKAAASTPSSLPPLKTILQRVIETSAVENAQYHQFNQHYFYRRDKVTEFFNGAGKLEQRREKQSTNNPVPRTITVGAARPAPPQIITARGVARKAESPNIHGVALGKKEDLMNPDILKRFTFTLVGRDTINGRPALIVNFAPVSGSLPVFNIKDRFINSMEGRAWVDAKDFTLEKVELRLRRKVSVLGGIAGAVSKFTFSFDRERTPDGYWFTRDLNWHVEAREATIQRIVDHHEQILSVQKMR